MKNNNFVPNEENDRRLDEARRFWNHEAASFDNEPDHGLHEPVVLDAWTKLLQTSLPPAPARILDIGCGTGSLSVVLTTLGYSVTAIDLSPAMIIKAQQKAKDVARPVSFYVMDASTITFSKQKFDGIVCRHLLWTLPNLPSVLQHWVDLMAENGRLLLIEGYWHTGGGLHSEDLVTALPNSLSNIAVQDLSDQSDFWGKPVEDERYAVTTQLTH